MQGTDEYKKLTLKFGEGRVNERIDFLAELKDKN
jgi:hypothetical protein